MPKARPFICRRCAPGLRITIPIPATDFLPVRCCPRRGSKGTAGASVGAQSGASGIYGLRRFVGSGNPMRGDVDRPKDIDVERRRTPTPPVPWIAVTAIFMYRPACRDGPGFFRRRYAHRHATHCATVARECCAACRRDYEPLRDYSSSIQAHLIDLQVTSVACPRNHRHLQPRGIPSHTIECNLIGGAG